MLDTDGESQDEEAAKDGSTSFVTCESITASLPVPTAKDGDVATKKAKVVRDTSTLEFAEGQLSSFGHTNTQAKTDAPAFEVV